MFFTFFLRFIIWQGEKETGREKNMEKILDNGENEKKLGRISKLSQNVWRHLQQIKQMLNEERQQAQQHFQKVINSFIYFHFIPIYFFSRT